MSFSGLTRSALRAVVVTGCFGASVLVAQREARAAVNLGAEAGIIKRESLNVGPAFGFHAELNPILGLYVGGYYFHYSLPRSEQQTPNENSLHFDAFGARARYLLDLPTLPIRPYGLLGVGYTRATFPSLHIAQPIMSPTMSSSLGAVDQRDGHFMELPIGIGVVYEAFRVVQFDLGFTYRPGFAFGGTAFDPGSPYSKLSSGWSLTLGASLDF